MNLNPFKKKQTLAVQANPIETSTKNITLSRTFATANNKYDFSNPMLSERWSGNDWIPMGLDNLYAQHLNELYYTSPLHASIINFKQLAIQGQGYTLTYDSNVSEAVKIKVNQFENLIDGNTSLKELVSNITMDYLIHNRICLKIQWNKDHTAITRVNRIAPEKVRYQKPLVGDDLTDVWISDDWGQLYGGYCTPYKLPLFDMLKKDEPTQVLVYQTMAPGLRFYTQPAYSPAANWMYLNGQSSYFQKCNLEQSVNPSMIIKFPNMPANQQEVDDFIRDFTRSYAGSANAGKVLTLFGQSRDEIPEVQQLDANKLDKTFTVLADIISQEICRAHQMDAVLIGISDAGQLGNTQQLLNAYQIFNTINVEPIQEKIESLINKIIKINKLPVKFKLNDSKFITLLNNQLK